MRWVTTRRKKRFRETVDEAERLLNGRLLESRDICESRTFVWGVVATLGHASLTDLRRFEAAVGRRCPDPWRGVVAFLATETLSAAADEDALIRLQRKVLIPLELSLLGGEVPSPSSPLGIVSLVRRALNTPLLPDT